MLRKQVFASRRVWVLNISMRIWSIPASPSTYNNAKHNCVTDLEYQVTRNHGNTDTNDGVKNVLTVAGTDRSINHARIV